jgi:hypothetical protein
MVSISPTGGSILAFFKRDAGGWREHGLKEARSCDSKKFYLLYYYPKSQFIIHNS